LVILAYTLLALALTWPLAANLCSHVPGNGVDDPPLTWNLWWVQHALLDLGINPFACEFLFYPLGINLAFYTLTILNGLLSIPLQAIWGLIPASNILLISSFILGGYGAFLLALDSIHSAQLAARNARDWGHGVYSRSRVSYAAAFAAGALYAYASSKMSYAALGQWNIASSQWIPFYVLYLFKMGRSPRRWRYPLMAALFLVFQAYAELTFATFLVLFTGLWAVWQVVASWRASDIGQVGRLSAGLALLGLIFVLGLFPMLAMMVPDMLVEGDILVEGGGFAAIFSADLAGFLVPTRLHPLFGSLADSFSFHHGVGQHIYVGYAALVLAVVGGIAWWRRIEVRFWVLSILVFWLLTMGPSLQINGQDTGLPLPFALVAQLPFFRGNRYPSRYSVLLVLSLSVLVGFGLLALLNKIRAVRPRWLERKGLLAASSLLLVALLLFEHLSCPLPLSDMQVPVIYRMIAEEMPGDWTLLDLPVAWRNGARVTGTQDPIIMFQQYYQSVHGKRILAGNTSRNPPLKFQYFTEAPLINTLIALETGHSVDPAVVDRDRILAADVLRFLNIEAVVIHPAEAGPEVVSYVETTMPVEPFYEGENAVAYDVDLPPWPEAWSVVPGDELARLSYAEGWGLPAHGMIWAQRMAARLLVPLDGSPQRMTFRAYGPADGQRLWVEVNGQPIQRIDLTPGWAEYEAIVPAGVAREGLNELWLRFDKVYPASELRLSPRAIGRTGVESPVNLVVQSAGLEVGSFGHIYVDGVDVSPNRRGYNVAVIHPQTGQVEQVGTFDTHLDEGASQALADFLRAIPQARIVAVAAADEASRLLGQEAVDALRDIGASGDLRDKFRWGQAIVGVKGASPGTALEALDWMRPASIVVGEGATEPSLTAAFGTMTFAAEPRP